MSASINCKEFAEYFATPIQDKMNPAYVFEVHGTPYAVEEFYLEDLQNLFPFRVLVLLMFIELVVLYCEAKMSMFLFVLSG